MIARLGLALYGAHWPRPLAEAVGVSLRTMQRWARDDYMPADRLVVALRLLQDRETEGTALFAEIRKRLP